MSDKKWIPKNLKKGLCTPMTKSTCTPRRKALARTFKKHHGFHEEGGKVPEYGLGGLFNKALKAAGDLGVGTADNALGILGGGNIIKDTAYSSQKRANTFNTIGKIKNTVGDAALNIIAPGAGSAMASLQTAGESAIQDNTYEDKLAREELMRQQEKKAMLTNYYSNYKPSGMYAPTFCKGGKVKYPNGGEVDEKYDMLMPYRDTYNQYGVDSPELYKMFSTSPSKEMDAYYTVANEQNQGKQFLTNWNNRFAKSAGYWYDPDSTTGLKLIKDKPWTSYGLPPVKRGTTHAGEGYTGISSTPYLKMAYGGMAKANAELEQGEPYRLPNGEIEMVSNQAPTHAEGGVQMNLPGGTEILGKNTAPNGEMYKQIGQRLKKAQDRYDKVLSSRPTEIAKRTAKMMLDRVQKEYEALFQQQEAEKGYHQMPDGSMMADSEMQYAAEGTRIKPKYSDTPYQIANPYDIPAYKSTDWSANNMPSNSQGFGSNLGSIAGAIGEYAPIAYNLISGLQKPKQYTKEEFQNPYEEASLNILRNNRYSPNAALMSNKNQGMAYNKSVRDLGLSGGQLAANLAVGSINRMRADSEAMERANQINSGYANQYASALGSFGQQRASTNMTTEDLNTREKAAREAALQAGLSQLSQATQAGMLRKNTKARDAQKLALMDSLVSNYVLTSDGRWVSRTTGKPMTKQEINNYLEGR